MSASPCWSNATSEKEKDLVGSECSEPTTRVARPPPTLAAMPTPPLPSEVQDLLARPNPSVITSLRADGSPVSVATMAQP